MARDTFDLIILKGPQEGKRLRFQSAEVTIGRAMENMLVVNSPAVSAKNSRIHLQNEEFFIDDLKSLNGTFVNNKKVERKKLLSGDKIEIGTALLLFMRKGEDPVTRTAADEEEKSSSLPDDVGNKTMVMGSSVDQLQLRKGAAPKAVPKVGRNPVIITLIVLILLVSAAIGYYYLQPYLSPASTPAASNKGSVAESGTPAVTDGSEGAENGEVQPPAAIEIILPRIERGEMTSGQIIAKADDHYNRGKQSYNNRKLKDENLHDAIVQWKQTLAYLQLTDQLPDYADELRPMLEKAITELDKESDELLFLARRFSRQEDYTEAKKYYEKIMRVIPDPEDKRNQAADKAIKYLISRNLVKL